MVEPFLSGAEQALGAKLVLSQCSGSLASFPLSGYFATAAWTQQNPHTAAAFQRAMAKAQAYADANPAAVRAVLPTYTKVTAAAAQHLVLNSFPATLSAAQLQRVADLMHTGGVLKIPFTMSIALILSISTGYLTGRISGAGIGAFIAEANTGAGNTALVLAAAIWTGLLGLLLNGVLLGAQHRLLPWAEQYRAEVA